MLYIHMYVCTYFIIFIQFRCALMECGCYINRLIYVTVHMDIVCTSANISPTFWAVPVHKQTFICTCLHTYIHIYIICACPQIVTVSAKKKTLQIYALNEDRFVSRKDINVPDQVVAMVSNCMYVRTYRIAGNFLKVKISKT